MSHFHLASLQRRKHSLRKRRPRRKRVFFMHLLIWEGVGGFTANEQWKNILDDTGLSHASEVKRCPAALSRERTGGECPYPRTERVGGLTEAGLENKRTMSTPSRCSDPRVGGWGCDCKLEWARDRRGGVGADGRIAVNGTEAYVGTGHPPHLPDI